MLWEQKASAATWVSHAMHAVLPSGRRRQVQTFPIASPSMGPQPKRFHLFKSVDGPEAKCGRLALTLLHLRVSFESERHFALSERPTTNSNGASPFGVSFEGPFGQSWGPVGSPWGSLGPYWGRPGALLDHLGGPGPRWRPLGSLWGPSWGSLVRLLKLSWAFLEPSSALLVLSWDPLGALLGRLWGHPGPS